MDTNAPRCLTWNVQKFVRAQSLLIDDSKLTRKSNVKIVHILPRNMYLLCKILDGVCSTVSAFYSKILIKFSMEEYFEVREYNDLAT